MTFSKHRGDPPKIKRTISRSWEEDVEGARFHAANINKEKRRGASGGPIGRAYRSWAYSTDEKGVRTYAKDMRKHLADKNVNSGPKRGR